MVDNTKSFKKSGEESWNYNTGKPTWSWLRLQHCTQTVPAEARFRQHGAHEPISVLFNDGNDTGKRRNRKEELWKHEEAENTQGPQQNGNRGSWPRSGRGETPSSSQGRPAIPGEWPKNVSARRNRYQRDATWDQWTKYDKRWREPKKVHPKYLQCHETDANGDPWTHSGHYLKTWHSKRSD